NENRSYKIFEEFAYHLIGISRAKNSNDNFEIKGKIYAFDATTIDLCLSVFYWANFRKSNAGIKLHTQFEINAQVPVFIHFTNANIHDVNAMDFITYEQNSYYIFDKAYVDFLRLFVITNANAFFVIRAKTNLKFRRIYSQKTDKSSGIIYDQIGKLTSKKALKNYPNKLRKVKFYDKQTNKFFVFLTNDFELTALQIALLYKQRWQIELFFKWIKQHLKVKTFWGTSENAVRIQINIAIITFFLVSIIANDLKINRTNYEILQILSVSLLDKTLINELLMKSDYNNVNELDSNQLNFSLF
ncbi:MAG: IS4 family transposase, partial [Flavobacteriaceae bacterium]|nr:IS4 family transposase [Flavobacteriaceae bacterium]